MDQPANTTIIIQKDQKSIGVALLLSILFGPLGMLYVTVSGAIIMLVISVLLSMVTFGLSLLITWPICIIWAAVAAAGTKNATR